MQKSTGILLITCIIKILQGTSSTNNHCSCLYESKKYGAEKNNYTRLAVLFLLSICIDVIESGLREIDFEDCGSSV